MARRTESTTPSQPEFTPDGLRQAASILEERALGGGDLSVGMTVEIRALAKHLRQLSDTPQESPQEAQQ